MWNTESGGWATNVEAFFSSLFGVLKRSLVFIFKKIVGTNTGIQKELLNWSDYFKSLRYFPKYDYYYQIKNIFFLRKLL